MHTLLPQARSEDYMKKNIEKIICFSSCILHSCPDNALCFSSCIPHSCPDHALCFSSCIPHSCRDCACGSKVCIYLVLQVDDDQYLLQTNHSSCYCFSFFLDYQTFPEFQHTSYGFSREDRIVNQYCFLIKEFYNIC